MDEKKIIGQRLKEFLNDINLKQTDLASYLNLKPQRITELINGKSNVQNYSNELFDLGLNLNWLLTGHGDKFADNDKGRELKTKHPVGSNYAKKLIEETQARLGRIKDFIIKQFGSLENFCQATGISINRLDGYLNGKLVDSFEELFNALRKANCNLTWVYTGAGNMLEKTEEDQVRLIDLLKSSQQQVDDELIDRIAERLKEKMGDK